MKKPGLAQWQVGAKVHQPCCVHLDIGHIRTLGKGQQNLFIVDHYPQEKLSGIKENFPAEPRLSCHLQNCELNKGCHFKSLRCGVSVTQDKLTDITGLCSWRLQVLSTVLPLEARKYYRRGL